MPISLLLDENMPWSVLLSLSSAGYDTVRLKTRGISDPEVLDLAKKQNRTVVTFDRGFANTLVYPPEEFCGIILFRRKSALTTTEDVQILTNRLLEYLSDLTSLDGQLCIVERARVRRYSGLDKLPKRSYDLGRDDT